jgi:hypothetical protein
MAPLDDLNGERVLAEFEAMIRGTGEFDPSRTGSDEFHGLVPERRAVNWVNALAALAREIEERQGPRRAEILLRTVGTRMSRELLTPLPSVRDEFEPAINRALSILDWGWVAVLDRQDTIVFEHRTPWPFDKRLDQLPFVLEGFYTDTLHRLADSVRMQVRLTGKRGGALVFKWLPADAPERAAQTHASSVIVPAAPEAPLAETPEPESIPLSADEVYLAAELEDAAVEKPQQEFEDRRLPPLTEPRRSRMAQEPRMPVTLRRVAPRPALGAGRVMLVAATVFIVLFSLGVLTSGDVIGGMTQRLGQLAAWRGGGARGPVSDLQNRALAGDADAQIRLGLQLASAATAKADYARAARWFEAAAKTGSLEAQYDLGVLTTDGLGVKRDPVGAAILFMNAAAGGFPQAEYRIGEAYRNGTGVPRSPAFAAMWYERAARHGVRQAQVALAGLYAAGDGVAADPVMAFAWYRLAEEEGDRAATTKRIELYRGLSTSQREAAMNQAKVLIGDVSGASNLMPSPAHPTVDRLIAQIS